MRVDARDLGRAKALSKSGQGFCRPAETFGRYEQRFALLGLETITIPMSTAHMKRKRADDADAGNHGRGYKQHKPYSKGPKPTRNPGSKYSHSRPGPSKSAEEEEAQKSINKLKSRIRDLRRLLAHTDSDPKNRMPQGIRIERERELESCKHELEEKQTAKREAKFRNDIIGKYHMVRFFGESICNRTCLPSLIMLRTAKGYENPEAPSQTACCPGRRCGKGR